VNDRKIRRRIRGLGEGLQDREMVWRIGLRFEG
jgi:hypothetical protein